MTDAETGTVTEPHGSEGEAEPPRRRRGPGRLLAVASFALVLAAGSFVAFAVRRHDAPPGSISNIRPSGTPADVSTKLAFLMGLDALPPKKAPGFILTDQRGHTISLDSFRGHPVVLEFMDPHCIDICPLVSQEFVDAYRDLGRQGRDVVFLGINVNPYALSVGDVAAFSSDHGLDAIPTWHFLTGPLATLRAIWRRYGIAVIPRGPNGDVIHSSIVYFIGPNGSERFLAAPQDDHTKSGTAYLPAGQLASWGKGIALVAKDAMA